MKKEMTRKTKRIIFYTIAIALPIIQFCIFYIGINMNSFIIAFQKYEYSNVGYGYQVSFAGFSNFAEAIKLLGKNLYMIKNSFVLFVLTMVLSYPLALIFSFYIYKGYACSTLFKLFLYMPQIVSGLIFGYIFKIMVDGSVYFKVMEFFGVHQELGLLSNPSTRLGTVYFYNIWVGFGVNVMMFSNNMSGIDKSIVESAELDGATKVKEFWYITIPQVWGTLSSFIVISISGIFTNSMALLALVGDNGWDIASLGYYMYQKTLVAQEVALGNELSFSGLSALSLILTAILVPVVFTARHLFKKYGFSEN